MPFNVKKNYTYEPIFRKHLQQNIELHNITRSRIEIGGTYFRSKAKGQGQNDIHITLLLETVICQIDETLRIYDKRAGKELLNYKLRQDERCKRMSAPNSSDFSYEMFHYIEETVPFQFTETLQILKVDVETGETEEVLVETDDEIIYEKIEPTYGWEGEEPYARRVPNGLAKELRCTLVVCNDYLDNLIKDLRFNGVTSGKLKVTLVTNSRHENFSVEFLGEEWQVKSSIDGVLGMTRNKIFRSPRLSFYIKKFKDRVIQPHDKFEFRTVPKREFFYSSRRPSDLRRIVNQRSNFIEMPETDFFREEHGGKDKEFVTPFDTVAMEHGDGFPESPHETDTGPFLSLVKIFFIEDVGEPNTIYEWIGDDVENGNWQTYFRSTP